MSLEPLLSVDVDVDVAVVVVVQVLKHRIPILG
jgi:hypothetical protein